MDYAELIAQAEATSTAGWDFSSFFGDRFQETQPSWDYAQMVRARTRDATRMLDMGTGGGELLLSLGPLPPVTVATEGYGPNVSVAAAALAPRGIPVVQVPADEDAPLPFADCAFDLVVNRHEAYVPSEVARVLRPGGIFVTQQVGGRDLRELNEALGGGRHEFNDWGLAMAREQWARTGMEVVDSGEEILSGFFRDIGAVVLFLRIAPWQIPHFDVLTYEPSLRALHKHIQSEGLFKIHHHRFFITARKPGI